MRPKTQYTKSGDATIAYQVSGEGPLDLVFIPGWISNVEYEWENPKYALFFSMLGSFARLIRFDKRGTGLSDRDVGYPTLEDRMEDIRSVMDAVGSKKAAVFGISEAGFLSALFAATYPERASALILMGCSARGSWAEDYPYKATAAELSTWLSMVEENWGDPIDLSVAAPDAADQEWAAEWQGSLLRYSASPRTAVELARYGFDVDMRDILPTIRVPTLVIQRSGDRWSPIGNGKYLATHIPGAVYAEHDDKNHLIWAGDSEAIVAETRRFLTGLDTALPVERVLMTLMMTDIADSTAKLTELGDQKWVQVLGQHNAIVRDLLKRHGGTEVDNAGDGFLMSFDGPSHALACAQQVHSKMQALDLKVRIGIHMGECERTDHGLKGAAVHLTARILGEATPGTTLVTNTLRDLVVGSRFDFADAGEKALKGIPSKRALFRVSEPFQ